MMHLVLVNKILLMKKVQWFLGSASIVTNAGEQGSTDTNKIAYITPKWVVSKLVTQCR